MENVAVHWNFIFTRRSGQSAAMAHVRRKAWVMCWNFRWSFWTGPTYISNMYVMVVNEIPHKRRNVTFYAKHRGTGTFLLTFLLSYFMFWPIAHFAVFSCIGYGKPAIASYSLCLSLIRTHMRKEANFNWMSVPSEAKTYNTNWPRKVFNLSSPHLAATSRCSNFY